jgi:hypothetical protein
MGVAVAEVDDARRRLEQLLDRHGLLLLHDARFPSATTCIAGEPVRGSWWGHAKGNLIYETLERLTGTVAWAKLILGKETMVHRRLWPALVAVAESGQDWQLRGLKADTKRLLQRIRRGRPVRTDEAPKASRRKLGVVATELERRLLAHSYSEHTPSGHHVRFLETWGAWGRRSGVPADDLPAVAAAVAALSAPVLEWPGAPATSGLLPWRDGR